MTRDMRSREERRKAEGPATRALRPRLYATLQREFGLGEALAVLFVDLVFFGEVLVDPKDAANVWALVSSNLAELRPATPRDPPWQVRVAATDSGDRTMRHVLDLMRSQERQPANDNARRRARSEPPSSDRTKGTKKRSDAASSDAVRAKMTPAIEAALIDNARAMQAGAPSFLRRTHFYVLPGRRYARVVGATSAEEVKSRRGSVLHFVELATGRVYAAKSSRQVGRFTGRVIKGLPHA